jgi:hypothetical protein
MTALISQGPRIRLSIAMKHASKLPRYTPLRQHRFYSNPSPSKTEERSEKASTPSKSDRMDKQSQPEQCEASAKTVAQADQELLEKLESMCGSGGAAALELENGKPVTMKRGVRENMFRLI